MRSLLAFAVCAAALSSSTLSAAPPAALSQLRPQGDRLTQLLSHGISRSATLKALADRVEASNVIVYITTDPTMKSGLSGTLTWMTRVGQYRYLRASISADLPPHQLIATIAHELQHAVEVIDDDMVSDEHTLAALYRRIGQQHGNWTPSRWETDAAQRTGFQVRKELLDRGPATTLRTGDAG